MRQKHGLSCTLLSSVGKICAFTINEFVRQGFICMLGMITDIVSLLRLIKCCICTSSRSINSIETMDDLLNVGFKRICQEVCVHTVH